MSQFKLLCRDNDTVAIPANDKQTIEEYLYKGYTRKGFAYLEDENAVTVLGIRIIK